MRLLVLGPVEVTAEDGSTTAVGPPREQIVAVALALAAPDAVSTGELIDVLWGDEPPATASSTLKSLVHRLRRRHGTDLVATVTGGYRLGPVKTDVVTARSLIESGRAALVAGGVADAVDQFELAVSHFRGPPTPALASTVPGMVLGREIDALRDGAVEGLVDARLAAGAGAELLGELEAAVVADPLQERGWERLMVALYRSGRQAGALGAFQRARNALVEGAGIEPGSGLRDLEQRIIDQDPTLRGGAFNAPAAATAEFGAGARVLTPPAGNADLGWFEPTTPFSGRDDDLTRVNGAISEAVRTRQQRLVLVSGDAGMGKTRLAGEVSSSAASQGATVMYGACDPGIATSYRPFAMALDRFSASHPSALVGQALSVVARIAPVLRDRYQLDESDRAVEADDDHRVHAAFARLLGALAEDHGLVLVVDDCQWASTATISLLRHLLADPTPSSVTIIATYRPRDLTETSPLARVLAEFHRNSLCIPVHLDRLGRDDLHRLIARSAGHDVPMEVTERVDHATGGNPYLVVSTLRHLVDTDLVVRRNQRWEINPGALDILPAGIRHLISEQIAALPNTAVTLLHVASVAGLTFSLRAAAAVADLDHDAALDAIETAALAGLVREDGFDRWRWDHDLARSVVADQLSTTRRVQTHWRFARVLAEHTDPDFDDIAHHVTEGLLAAPAGEASPLLAEAANVAIRRDPVAALAYANTALDNVDLTGDTHTSTTLLCIRAIALLETVGDVLDPRVVQATTAAEEAALTNGDPDLVVRAHTLDNRYPGNWYTPDTRHIAACRRALDNLPRTVVDHRAQILSHLVELHRYSYGDPVQVELEQRLMEALDSGVSPTTRQQIQQRLEQGELLYGRTDLGSGAAQPLDRDYWRLDPHDERAEPSDDSLLQSVQQALVEGDLGEAEVVVRVLMGRSDGQNDSLQLTTRTCGAVLHSARGNLRGLDSDRVWLQGFTPNVRNRALYDEAIRSVTAAITLVSGSPSGIVDEYAAMAEQDQLHPMFQVAYRIAACWLAAATSDHDAAQRHLDVLIDTKTGLAGTIETTALYADAISRYRPHLAASSEAHRLLAPHSGQWLNATGMSLGPVDLYLAKLAYAAGKDHLGYLHAAIDAVEQAGATFWLDRCQEFLET